MAPFVQADLAGWPAWRLSSRLRRESWCANEAEKGGVGSFDSGGGQSGDSFLPGQAAISDVRTSQEQVPESGLIEPGPAVTQFTLLEGRQRPGQALFAKADAGFNRPAQGKP